MAENLDPEVRVVVLKADGSSFSGGIDLGMLTPEGVEEVSLLASAAEGAEAMAETIAPYQRGFTAWADVDAVVVAGAGPRHRGGLPARAGSGPARGRRRRALRHARDLPRARP